MLVEVVVTLLEAHPLTLVAQAEPEVVVQEVY
jgi:hypothetical protein